jgi:hypothetical protein
VPAGPVQQCYPELLLEPADLVAQGGLGDVQPLGGPAEVKFFSDGDEVLDEPQVQAFDRRNLLIESQLVLDFDPLAEQTGHRQ